MALTPPSPGQTGVTVNRYGVRCAYAPAAARRLSYGISRPANTQTIVQISTTETSDSGTVSV